MVLPHLVGLIVLAVWLVLSGVFGYRAARVVEPYEGVGNPRSYIAFRIAALVAVAIGYWQYTSAADRAYASALAAHRQGKCAHALDLYRRVERFYKLSYRSFHGVSAKERDCRALVQVDGLVASRRFERALVGYKRFQLEHPGTLGVDAWVGGTEESPRR